MVYQPRTRIILDEGRREDLNKLFHIHRGRKTVWTVSSKGLVTRLVELLRKWVLLYLIYLTTG